MTPISLMNWLRTGRALRYGERIRPIRDWLVVLGVSVALLVASAVWNTWIFIDVVQGEVIGSAESPADTPNGSIEAVQKLFDARGVEKARYENEHRFVDPSR